MKFTTKLLLIGALLFLIIEQANAQALQRLSIGDRLPDFVILKMINNDQQITKTSDFNDRLLILDFWGTTCGTCIKLMPEMQAFQKQFGKRIKILPVAMEGKKELLDFWKTNSYTKNLSLPSVAEDKIFGTYFPNRGVPHEVWIYKGIVIAITNHEYVNEYNINRVLNGEQIRWEEKNDLLNYDYSKSLFKYENYDLISTKFNYTGITGYIYGVNSYAATGRYGIVRDSINKKVRTYFINYPIYFLYQVLFRNTHRGLWQKPYGNTLHTSNQIQWEVDDRSKYRFFEVENSYIQEWNVKNQICFESLEIDSGQSDHDIYMSMINKLNQLLHLDVRLERRYEEVYSITRLEGIRKRGLELDNKKFNLENDNDYVFYHEIIYLLNNKENYPYVFDMVGNIDQEKVMISKQDIYNFDILKSALLKQGLKLNKEVRQVDKILFHKKGILSAMISK